MTKKVIRRYLYAPIMLYRNDLKYRGIQDGLTMQTQSTSS